MPAFWWILMPLIISIGSCLLTFVVMQARAEVLAARGEKALAEARIALAFHQELASERAKAGEEATRRKALDEFLADVRVEERHYVRKTSSMLTTRRHLVLQERIYFRNIPLSNWIEKELLIQQGSNLEKLARASSVFTPERRLLARDTELLNPENLG